ncbi:MAG: hypothetical protein KDK30_04605 [Leptospiraceae bacterium]|nr:hypothetical protein [Leptospiraceae bacterium]
MGKQWISFLLALFLCSCAGNQVPIDGTFINKETGGYIIFRPDGTFYYSLTTPESDEGTLPANRGHYAFQNKDDREPYLNVRAAHAGVYRIIFNADRTEVTVEYVREKKPPGVYILRQE